MKSENKFLKPDTRKTVIVLSVIFIVLALVNAFLLIFSSPATENTEDIFAILFSGKSFLIGLVIFVFAIIATNAIKIKIFYDYKRQNKSLLVDAITQITSVALMIVMIILVAFTISTTYGSIYVYTVLFALLTIWQILIAIKNTQLKSKANVYEFIKGAILLAFTVLVTILFVKTNTGTAEGLYTIMMLCTIAMLIYTIVCAIENLVLYCFNDPIYLETQEGLDLLVVDYQKKLEQQRRIQSMRTNILDQTATEFSTRIAEKKPTAEKPAETATADSIEEKIEKLDKLFKKQLITEEEYKAKKQKLIDEL